MLHCSLMASVNINIWDSNTTGSVNAGSFPVSGNVLIVPLVTTACGIPLNTYDGVYSVESGWVQRYTSAGVPEVGPLNGDLTGNPDVYLLTTDANSVTIPAAPGPGELMYAFGSSSAIAGIDPLQIVVDGSNNVWISNTVLVSLGNWAGHPNTYDPATKTFHMAFTWISAAGTFREYEIVLKYKHPR
jgi:hypothetical protein